MLAGVVAALPAESKCLSAGSGRNPLLAVSGIGPRAAAGAAGALIEQGATGLVSWGLAGGLSAGLEPGDLLLPRTVIDVNGESLHPDDAWRQRLVALLSSHLRWHEEALAESDGIVHSVGEKRQLAEDSGAVAVDMESAAIGRVADMAGIPFVVIRSVADTADEVPPAFLATAVDPAGRLMMRRLLPAVLVHPGAWLRLARLGRHTRAALRTLHIVSEITNRLWAVTQGDARP